MEPEEIGEPEEIDRWHDVDVAEWHRRWRVPALRIFRRVGSTNDVARELAEAGAAEGALVLADEQTRGRGRRGRAWSAPAGASLSMSMVLRPRTATASRILTLRLGLAAARAMERLLPIQVELKWPNDLTAEGRKIGGILCEAVLVEDRVQFVLAGIGLNLRRPDDGWTPDLAARATSIQEAAATTAAGPDDAPVRRRTQLDVPALVEQIAGEWRAVAARSADRLSSDELERFRDRDALRGRAVAVEGRPAGVAEGITPAGQLRVRQGGQVQEISAGTVRAIESLLGERT